jgi:hypothetical protein
MCIQIAGEKFAAFSDLFSRFPILGMNQDSALAGGVCLG